MILGTVLAALRPSPGSLRLATLSRKREKGFRVLQTVTFTLHLLFRPRNKSLSRLRERVAEFYESG